MTRCGDMYKKWRRERNFCGLGNATAKNIDRYLEFVDELILASGIEEDIIYANVPCSTVNPVLKFKIGSEMRNLVVKKIVQTLNNKQSITLRFVNNVLGIAYEPKKMKPNPLVPTSEALTKFDKNKLKDKIRLIYSILDSGQHKILLDTMTKKGLDNEYEALCLLITTGAKNLQ